MAWLYVPGTEGLKPPCTSYCPNTETVRFGVCISDSGDRAVYARGRMRVVVSCGALVITAFRMRQFNPKRIMRERRRREQRYARGR